MAAKQIGPAGSCLNPEADLPNKEPMDGRKYLGLAGDVAQDVVYVRNTRFPNGYLHFPVEPLMRTVDKFFPQAVDGPLYIDEPVSKREIADCKRKAAAMKLEKLRYAYIAPEMTLEDILKQLEEDHRGVA